MRTANAAALVLSLLGAGVAGWLARGRDILAPPMDAPPAASESTPRAPPRAVDGPVAPSPSADLSTIDARIADLVRRIDSLTNEVGALRRRESTPGTSIASELQALKAQIAAIAVTQEALAKHAGVPPPWPSDPAEVEKIRDRWRSKLEETEKVLRAAYPQGPDPRGDVGVWSRFDDLQRARAAFDAATDSASLRALSDGVFHGYFTLTR